MEILETLMQYFYMASLGAYSGFFRVYGSEKILTYPKLIAQMSPVVFSGSKYRIRLTVLMLTSRDRKFFFFSVLPILSAAEVAAVDTLFLISP